MYTIRSAGTTPKAGYLVHLPNRVPTLASLEQCRISVPRLPQEILFKKYFARVIEDIWDHDSESSWLDQVIGHNDQFLFTCTHGTKCGYFALVVADQRLSFLFPARQ